MQSIALYSVTLSKYIHDISTIHAFDMNKVNHRIRLQHYFYSMLKQQSTVTVHPKIFVVNIFPSMVMHFVRFLHFKFHGCLLAQDFHTIKTVVFKFIAAWLPNFCCVRSSSI